MFLHFNFVEQIKKCVKSSRSVEKKLQKESKKTNIRIKTLKNNNDKKNEV